MGALNSSISPVLLFQSYHVEAPEDKVTATRVGAGHFMDTHGPIREKLRAIDVNDVRRHRLRDYHDSLNDIEKVIVEPKYCLRHDIHIHGTQMDIGKAVELKPSTSKKADVCTFKTSTSYTENKKYTGW